MTQAQMRWYAAAVLRYVLLSLLASGRPSYGYALMKAYAQRTGFKLSIGNVYRELQRLAAQGLITSSPKVEGADARRAPYAITAEGRWALAGWLRSPTQAAARRSFDGFSARLAAAAELDPDETAALLENMRAELWAEAKAVERNRAKLRSRQANGGVTFPIRETLLTRRAMQLAADIELLNQLTAGLREPAAPATRTPPRSHPSKRPGLSNHHRGKSADQESYLPGTRRPSVM